VEGRRQTDCASATVTTTIHTGRNTLPSEVLDPILIASLSPFDRDVCASIAFSLTAVLNVARTFEPVTLT
jgi:hypothetical protein